MWKLGHEGVRGRCASMNMFLMLRPAKYDVALVGSKVGGHFDAAGIPQADYDVTCA